MRRNKIHILVLKNHFQFGKIETGNINVTTVIAIYFPLGLRNAHKWELKHTPGEILPKYKVPPLNKLAAYRREETLFTDIYI